MDKQREQEYSDESQREDSTRSRVKEIMKKFEQSNEKQRENSISSSNSFSSTNGKQVGIRDINKKDDKPQNQILEEEAEKAERQFYEVANTTTGVMQTFPVEYEFEATITKTVFPEVENDQSFDIIDEAGKIIQFDSAQNICEDLKQFDFGQNVCEDLKKIDAEENNGNNFGDDIHSKIEPYERLLNEGIKLEIIDMINSTEVLDGASANKDSNWQQILSTEIDENKDIILEVDTCGMADPTKESPVVELVVAVQSAIKQRQELLEGWRNKAELLNSQVRNLTKQNECCNAELDNKSHEIQNLLSEIVDLKRDYVSIKCRADGAIRELEYCKDQNGQYVQLNKNQCKEISSLKESLQNAEESNCKLDRKVKLQEQQSEHWMKQSECLTEQLSLAKDQVKELAKQIEQSDNTIYDLEQQIANLNSQERQDTHSLDKIKSLQSNLDSCLHQVKAYASKNEVLQSQICDLDQLISRIKTEKCEIEKKLEQSSLSLDSSLERNDKQQKELLDLKQKITSYQYSICDMEAEIKQMEQKLEIVTCENGQLRAEIDAVKNKNKSLNENLSKVEADYASVNGKLKCVQNEIEEKINDYNSLESKYHALVLEKIDLEDRIATLQCQEKMRLKTLDELVDENCQLKLTKEDLHRQLESTKQALDETNQLMAKYKLDLCNLTSSANEQRINLEAIVKKLTEELQCKTESFKDELNMRVKKIKSKYKSKLLKKLTEQSTVQQTMTQSTNDLSQNTTLNDSICSSELLDEICFIKKQLGDSTRKLEDTIFETELEQKKFFERTLNDQQKLLDQILSSKSDKSWFLNELEKKLQAIMSQQRSDSEIIQTLQSENSKLQDRIAELRKNESNIKDVSELVKELDSLKADLCESKHLCHLAEEVAEQLKNEKGEISRQFNDLKKRFDELHALNLSLEFQIGQKNAEISVLCGTVANLRSKIACLTNENNELECTISNLEQQKNNLEKDVMLKDKEISSLECTIKSLRDTITDLNCNIERSQKQLFEVYQEKNDLFNQIIELKDKLELLQRALDESQSSQQSLRQKLKNKDEYSKKVVQDMNDMVQKIMEASNSNQEMQCKLMKMTNELEQVESSYQSKLNGLRNELKAKNLDLEKVQEYLSQQKCKNSKLHQCLETADRAYCQLARMFDLYCQTVCDKYTEMQMKPFSHTRSYCECLNLDMSQDFDPATFYKQKLDNKAIYEKNLDFVKECIQSVRNREKKLECQIKDLQEELCKLKVDYCSLDQEKNRKLESIKDQLMQKECEFSKLKEKLEKIQEVESCQGQEFNKSLCDQVSRLKESLGYSEDARAQLQQDIFNQSKKQQILTNEKFDCDMKLKSLESKHSFLQLRHCSLEGELQKLKLELAESKDREYQLSCSHEKMSYDYSELVKAYNLIKVDFEKSKKNAFELENKLEQEVENAKKSHSKTACCMAHGCHLPSQGSVIEKKNLYEKLETAQNNEHESKLKMISHQEQINCLKKQMSLVEKEKANLQGWVVHLQKIINGLSSGGINSDNKQRKKKDSDCALTQKINQLQDLVAKLSQESQSNHCEQLTKPDTDKAFEMEKDLVMKKYNELKCLSEKRGSEIANLKNEILVLKSKLKNQKNNFPSKNCSTSFDSSSDDYCRNYQERMTTCVVTYAPKMHEKQSKSNVEFHCKDCDHDDEKKQNPNTQKLTRTQIMTSVPIEMDKPKSTTLPKEKSQSEAKVKVKNGDKKKRKTFL